ncbi:hypothetical protein BC829DRAFT_492862 [Chytridium lagenaria]|nr:hypothetical protein BC829DRAFT_492862 [Chytridium lagenaria]
MSLTLHPCGFHPLETRTSQISTASRSTNPPYTPSSITLPNCHRIKLAQLDRTDGRRQESEHHQAMMLAIDQQSPRSEEEVADLDAAESRIDFKILNHIDATEQNRKQKRFRRTVFAVQAIVSAKLYKSKSPSLEAYFKDVWKNLDGFEYLPCRERLCRSLKRLARNRSDIRKLWASVLDHVQGRHEEITSTIVSTVWSTLLSQSLVTGLQEFDPQRPPDYDHHTFYDESVEKWMKRDDEETDDEEPGTLELDRLESCLEELPFGNGNGFDETIRVDTNSITIALRDRNSHPSLVAERVRIATVDWGGLVYGTCGVLEISVRETRRPVLDGMVSTACANVTPSPEDPEAGPSRRTRSRTIPPTHMNPFPSSQFNYAPIAVPPPSQLPPTPMSDTPTPNYAAFMAMLQVASNDLAEMGPATGTRLSDEELEVAAVLGCVASGALMYAAPTFAETYGNPVVGGVVERHLEYEEGRGRVWVEVVTSSRGWYGEEGSG